MKRSKPPMSSIWIPEYEDLPEQIPLSDLLARIEEMRTSLCEEGSPTEKEEMRQKFNQALAPHALKLGLYLLKAREAFKKFPAELFQRPPHE